MQFYQRKVSILSSVACFRMTSMRPSSLGYKRHSVDAVFALAEPFVSKYFIFTSSVINAGFNTLQTGWNSRATDPDYVSFPCGICLLSMTWTALRNSETARHWLQSWNGCRAIERIAVDVARNEGLRWFTIASAVTGTRSHRNYSVTWIYIKFELCISLWLEYT